MTRRTGAWEWGFRALCLAILVFLMVPEQATQAHLEILSELAQMLSDPAFREQLITAPDAAGVHRLLVDWEPFRPAA